MGSSILFIPIDCQLLLIEWTQEEHQVLVYSLSFFTKIFATFGDTIFPFQALEIQSQNVMDLPVNCLQMLTLGIKNIFLFAFQIFNKSEFKCLFFLPNGQFVFIQSEVDVEARILRKGGSVVVTTIEFSLKDTKKLCYTARATFYIMPVASL
jgi:hypothetical protein